VTTKKKAQGGSKGKSRETLKAQALAAIADTESYDADGRRSIYVALENLKLYEAESGTESKEAAEYARKLAVVLDNAGKGIPPFDPAHFGEHYEAACLVWSILEGGENTLPDFLVGALMVALDEAARQQEMSVWLDVDGSGDTLAGGYSVQAMASLFSRSQFLSVTVEPKRDLAGLISAVLIHSEVPGLIYDKLTDALVEMHDSTDVYNNPGAVRALLEYHAERSAEEGARAV
jgi:hypothetical protein